METINNLTATASKAIWGENETSNKEPVSGVKGDTARGEPYDAGNLGALWVSVLTHANYLTNYNGCRNPTAGEGS
jgi:hypothetical protein